MKTINTFVTPVVTYSFDIINWKLNAIKKLDAKTENSYPNDDAPPEIQMLTGCTYLNFKIYSNRIWKHTLQKTITLSYKQ